MSRMRPPEPPLGLKLATTARFVSRAFDQALTEAGGSLPIWLVLLNLRIRPGTSQRELAEAVGVREATLTHHRNTMEQSRLITRRRDPDKADSARVFTLADVERMAYSLWELSDIDSKRLSQILGLVRAEAALYGLFDEPAEDGQG